MARSEIASMRAVFHPAILVSAGAMLLSGCGGARAFGQGVLSPLDDLNLRQGPIPRVLVDAAADPYGRRNTGRCGAIAQEVVALNAALGPDQDEPPAPRDMGAEAAQALGELSVGLLIDTATDFIPVRAWVRQLSGAEARSRRVQGAIQAGRMRRAYLKGVGMRMNCAPPAAPSWFRPRSDHRPPQRVIAPRYSRY